MASPFRQNHFRFGLQQTPVAAARPDRRPRRRRARRATERRREFHPCFFFLGGTVRPAGFAALLHRRNLLARRFRADAVPVGRFPLKSENRANPTPFSRFFFFPVARSGGAVAARRPIGRTRAAPLYFGARFPAPVRPGGSPVERSQGPRE